MPDSPSSLTAAAEYRIGAQPRAQQAKAPRPAKPRVPADVRPSWASAGRAVLATALLVAGVAYVGVGHSHLIVRQFPASARLYALAGAPVNLLGLALNDVQSRITEDGTTRVLTVQGSIANVEGFPRGVPDLRLALMAGPEKELYTWIVTAPKARLKAGESVAFQARLVSPPVGAEQVKIIFASANVAPPRGDGSK